jgi:hypothetical protein
MPLPFSAFHDSYLLRFVTTGRASIFNKSRYILALHADGSSGIVIDTLVGRAVLPSDSAPAMRAARGMLRTGRFVRASRLAPVRARAALPGYYDADPYPYMGARVLGGARVWSAMRARHAHRDLYDDDIDALFERAIGRYEAARSASEYAGTVQQMVSAFDDARSQRVATGDKHSASVQRQLLEVTDQALGHVKSR